MKKQILLIILFVAGCVGSMQVRAQITPANFGSAVVLNTGTSPVWVCVQDMNGDGHPDVLIANEGSNTISVFLNQASAGTITTGSFAAKADFTINGGTGPETIVVADIDGDGKPDIVATNFNGSSVSVLRNTSTGGGLSFAAEADFYVGFSAHAVAVGDIDGDGKPDLVVANSTAGTISLLKNNSTSGTIAFAAQVVVTIGGNPTAVKLYDLTGDGKPELLVTLNNQNLMTVIHNTATTGTVDANVFSIANRSDYATGAGPYALAIADLDGDGKADVAVTNVVGNTVSIFRNTGSGGAIAFAAKVDLPTGTYPNSISIADIDGDGKPDLVVSDWYVNGTVSIFRNQATSGAIGIASFVPKLDMPAGANPHAVAISDIDGDGRPDLIVANSYDNTFWVLQKR